MNNYSMKQIMEITKLTSDTLRYYEKDGLISDVKRLANGHRSYTSKDLEWLKFINCLKSTGMPLKKIKEYRELMSKGDITTTQRKQIMITQREKILQDMELLKEALQTIDWKIEFYKTVEESLN